MSETRFVRGRVAALALSGAAALTGMALLVAPTGAGAASRVHSVSVTYTCTLPDGLGTYSGAATFSGTTPATLASPGVVSMSGFQGQVSISGAELDKMSSYVTSVKGKVKTLDVNATDAKTRSVNVAGTGIPFGPVTVKSSGNANLVINIPSSPATIGPWTASKAGKMTFTAGKVSISITTKGTVSGTFTIGCTSKAPDTLSTTSVK